MSIELHPSTPTPTELRRVDIEAIRRHENSGPLTPPTPPLSPDDPDGLGFRSSTCKEEDNVVHSWKSAMFKS